MPVAPVYRSSNQMKSALLNKTLQARQIVAEEVSHSPLSLSQGLLYRHGNQEAVVTKTSDPIMNRNENADV